VTGSTRFDSPGAATDSALVRSDSASLVTPLSVRGSPFGASFFLPVLLSGRFYVKLVWLLIIHTFPATAIGLNSRRDPAKAVADGFGPVFTDQDNEPWKSDNQMTKVAEERNL